MKFARKPRIPNQPPEGISAETGSCKPVMGPHSLSRAELPMLRRGRLATVLALLVLGGGVVGHYFASPAIQDKDDRIAATPVSPFTLPRAAVDVPPRFRADRERSQPAVDVDAISNGALSGQRSLQFSDQQSLEDFLARATNGIVILDRSDRLNALRVGFSNPEDLDRLLDGSEEASFIFPVSAPAPADGDVQAGAVGLGNQLRAWLGIEGDNSGWGEGVTVAVLDSGIQPHSTFALPVRSISRVDSSLGHGTAVASVIAGSSPSAPGVAPSAQLVSIGIADDRGMSDSFELANGIMTALENGADLINISMGSQGDSQLVRSAIRAANDQGVLIVAAAGNHGSGQVSYPAANDGVIAVGAVDAMGNHLDFSNTGDSIDIAAAGFAVNAAWPDEKAVLATGTSFSAPIVTGAIAAVMSDSQSAPITASRAWEIIQSVLNDGGLQGEDPQFGAGMPDLGRVFRMGTPGILDAAVASQQILPATPNAPFGMLETTIQNRGTETLVNAKVEISLDGRRTLANITTLAPNEVRAVRIPLTVPPGESGITAMSSVSASGAMPDHQPANDRRQVTLQTIPAK